MKYPLHLTMLLSIALTLTCIVAEGRAYRYDGQARMVGELEYAIIDENCNNMHDLARQYNVGHDALVSANPHLSDDGRFEPGTLVYIPNKIILPKKLRPQTITINLPEKRLYYFDDSEKKLFVWPVGVGRLDHPSPEGKMAVMQIRYKPTWHVPKGVLAEAHSNGFMDHPKIVHSGPDNPLGMYAIHLSAQTYLIHSTNNPDLIGTRNTSGCINLFPEHIAELFSKIHVKTQVEIMNTPLKTYRSHGTLYVERYEPLWRTSQEQRDLSLSLALHHDIEQIIHQRDTTELPAYGTYKVDNLSQMLQHPVGYPIALVGV